MKQESVDTDESDSNKLEDVIDTSLTVKSEVTGDDDDDGEDDEKQDMEKDAEEKDAEESDADVLQNDGDIKLEDLEELNGVEDNKEVGLMMKQTTCIFSILDWYWLARDGIIQTQNLHHNEHNVLIKKCRFSK